MDGLVVRVEPVLCHLPVHPSSHPDTILERFIELFPRLEVGPLSLLLERLVLDQYDRGLTRKLLPRPRNPRGR